MLICPPCKEGRHDDCIKRNECFCYSYREPHIEPAKVANPFGHVRHLPAYDEDDTDGGLGSGRWLMGDIP